MWVPGSSNEAELRAAVAAFDELSATAGVVDLPDGERPSTTALRRWTLGSPSWRRCQPERADTRTGPPGRPPPSVGGTAVDPDERRALLKRVGVDIRIGVIDGTLFIHPVALGDRLPSLSGRKWTRTVRPKRSSGGRREPLPSGVGGGYRD